MLPCSPPLPIQTAPAPAARSVGVEAVLNVLLTPRSPGSIRVTVRSSASSTQTAPSPTAMLEGVVPSGTVVRSLPVSGSSTPTAGLGLASLDCSRIAVAGEQEGDDTHGDGENERAEDD